MKSSNYESGTLKKVILGFCFLLLTGCFVYNSQYGKTITESSLDLIPGTISAKFIVAKSGTASYKIPLQVPPGINGMQPKLKLFYSHQQGNGKLGLGWGLSGLSTIERSKAIIDIDGFAGGINYDDNDRFSLDGSRLININDGNYGADGTVYHTEVESWKKVQSYGQSGSGPEHFIVTTRSGTILEYGNTTDSRILANGKSAVRVWALNKVTDSNGNTMTITYTGSPVDINTKDSINSVGEYYPLRIDYTANENVASNRSVRFDYTTRQDLITNYQGGAIIQTAARLVSISTYVSSNLIKQYSLGYDSQTSAVDYSKITSITTAGPNQKLPSTIFTYLDGANTFALPTHALDNNDFSINGGWSDQNYYPVTMADVNGDGIMDIIGFKSGTQVALGLANPESGGAYFDSSKSWSEDFSNDSTNWSTESLTPRYVTDVNGDGMADVVGFGMKGVLVAISTGHSFDTSLWNNGKWFNHYGVDDGWNDPGLYPITFADVNGDLLTDIVGFKNGIQVALSNGDNFEEPVNWDDANGAFTIDTGWQADNIRILADVNGDSRADIIGFDDDGVHVGLSTGNGFDMETWNSGQVYPNYGSDQGWSSLSNSPIMVGDVNGDGLTDIIGFKNKVTVALSTGTTFIDAPGIDAPGTPLENFTTDQGWTEHDPRYLSDINNDGKMDIVGFNSNGALVALSTGTTFDSSLWNNGEPYPYFGYNQGWNPTTMKICLTDVSGNGITDIVGFGQSSVMVGIKPGPLPGLMNELTNGVGNKYSITYSPLSDPDVYQNMSTTSKTKALSYFTLPVPINMSIPAYKTMILNGGRMNVVKSYSTENASTNNKTYKYSRQFTYANAGFALNGRGWQGFEQFTAENTTGEDLTGGWKHTITSLQTFPFTGRIKQLLIQSGKNASDPKSNPGDNLSGRTIIYLCEPGSSCSNEIYQPYPGVYQVLPQTKVRDYYNYNTYKFSTARSYTYDRYGNKTIYADLNYTDQAGNDVSSKDNVYTLKKYSNITDNAWYIGYPLVELVSTNNDLSRLDNITSAAAPDYDNNSDFKLQTYTYDDNMNQQSNSSWDNGEEVSTWITYSYEYDQFGNRTKITDPAKNDTVWNYEKTYNTYPDNKVTPPNSNGLKFTNYYGYDPGTGTQVAVLDPNGNTTITVLDDFGRVTAKQGPVPDTPAGILSSNNEVSALVTGTASFKEASVIKLQTTEYKSNNNIIYQENSYLENWPTASISSNWSWDRNYTDALGRTYKFTSSKGPCDGKGNYTIELEYDCNNNLINQTLPYFEGDPIYKRTVSYDIYNRVLKIVSPAGTDGSETSVINHSYEITADGLTDYATRAADDTYKYKQNLTYKFFNSGEQVVSMVVPGDNNATTTYGYDVLGRPVNSVSPPIQDNPQGLTSTVVYDSLWRKKQIYNPSQGNIYFYFNNEGKLEKKTDTNGRAEFLYDNLARVRGINWYDAGETDEIFHSETFEYDNPDVPNGLLKRTGSTLRLADGTIESQYEYSQFDKYGRNTVRILTVDGGPQPNYTTKKNYDPGGRVINYIYPDGRNLSKEYNSCYLKQLNLDGQNYITYSNYTAQGSPQTITIGNGVNSNFTYDPTGQLLDYQVQDNSNKVLWHNSYKWNHLNIIEEIEDLDGTGVDYSQSFVYENLRLKQATSKGTYGTIQYAYDQAGNMTEKDNVSYTYSGYKVVNGIKNSESVFNARYDDMGNMKDVSDDQGNFQYKYNPLNLLTQATNTSSGVVTSFSYDNKGRRLKKTTPDGTTTIYVSDLYNVTIQPDNSVITKKYLKGLLGKEVEITTTPGKPDTTLYIHQNQVGSTLFTTGASGEMANLMFYKPYGELTNSGTGIINLKYTGKELDDSTGLYYYGARYYKPGIGRFITSDNGLGGSKTQQDAFNRYQYTLGNPIVYNDPSGKRSCVGFAGAGVMAGVFGGGALAYTVYGTSHSMGQTIGWTTSLVVSVGIGTVYNCRRDIQGIYRSITGADAAAAAGADAGAAAAVAGADAVAVAGAGADAVAAAGADAAAAAVAAASDATAAAVAAASDATAAAVAAASDATAAAVAADATATAAAADATAAVAADATAVAAAGVAALAALLL